MHYCPTDGVSASVGFTFVEIPNFLLPLDQSVEYIL